MQGRQADKAELHVLPSPGVVFQDHMDETPDFCPSHLIISDLVAEIEIAHTLLQNRGLREQDSYFGKL